MDYLAGYKSEENHPTKLLFHVGKSQVKIAWGAQKQGTFLLADLDISTWSPPNVW